MVPERHVPGDARPHEAEWGQGRSGLGRGRDRGSRLLQSRLGTPEGEGLQVGEGTTSPSHPSDFSHSHFPNSSVLPCCHGNCSLARASLRKPRARLSPLPITECPPPQAQHWCGRWRVMGVTTPDPERGPNLHPASPPPQEASISAPQLIREDRQTRISTAHASSAAATPTELRTPTRPPLPPASALQQAPPTVLRRPPSRRRPGDHGPLIRECPPPPSAPRGPSPPALPGPFGGYSQRGGGAPSWDSMPS